MRVSEASNVVSACDRHIGRILGELDVTDAGYEKVDLLCLVRSTYIDMLRNGDCTIEVPANLYGDGTPGNVSQPNLSDEIRRECEPFHDERVMGAQLGAGIHWFTQQDHETFNEAAYRALREARGEEKFGFRLGETVNLKECAIGYKPGTVQGFNGGAVQVGWNHQSADESHFIAPSSLRHGP